LLTFYRLAVAAIAMLVIAYQTKTLIILKRNDLCLVIASGVMLSLHFVTYIFAVKVTTVANATFLVSTSPVILAVLSPGLIGEKTTSREGASVIIATLGILLVAYAGNGFRSFGVGDLSALLASLFISFYSMIGRRLRTHGLSTTCYTAYVYSIAAIIALSLTGAIGSNPLRAYDLTNAMAILGLALVPTLLGHSLYNYSLRSVKVVTANLFPLLEPVLSSALAVQLFGEVPTLIQMTGYLLILLAVIIVVTTRSTQEVVTDFDNALKHHRDGERRVY